MGKVNYDEVAENYNLRYEKSYGSDGLADKLCEIIHTTNAKTILEVGCGTGHWLRTLPKDVHAIGLDASMGMLGKTKTNNGINLVQGNSSQLPFRNSCFDIIYCINAIHHFPDPPRFIKDCKSLLHQNGIFVNVCMNPHSGADTWFVYDYFKRTRECDLERYPSPDHLRDWLVEAGFGNVEDQVGEQLKNTYCGKDVLPLPKEFTSQLSLLSDDEYNKGMRRIHTAIEASNPIKEPAEFKVDISLVMITATAI